MMMLSGNDTDNNDDDDDDSMEDAVEDQFDAIKKIRETTRLRARLFHDTAPSNGRSLEQIMKNFENQSERYNLTPEQIEWFYPQSTHDPDFTMETHANTPNYWAEKEFLDLLLPTILPEDSYFDKGEIDYLNGEQFPLRKSVKYYIRKCYTFEFLLLLLLLRSRLASCSNVRWRRSVRALFRFVQSLQDYYAKRSAAYSPGSRTCHKFEWIIEGLC
jgi:hypothetical protein